MAVSREQARDVLIQRLYERSNDSEAEPEFEEEEIRDLVIRDIAPVIVHTILIDFLRNGLIRQTRAAPVMFEVTDSLLDEAEETLASARPTQQASRFENVKMHILHQVFLKTWSGEDKAPHGFDARDLPQLAPSHVSTHICAKAVDSLIEDGALEGELAGFKISAAGLRRVENDLNDESSLIAEISKRANLHPNVQGIAPASDRVVSLDHNGDPYKVAIAALDEAVASFKEDHSFENEWIAEKSLLIRTVEAGRALLDKSAAHVDTIYTTVINPIRTIVSKYKAAIVEGLVRAAADELINLGEKAIKLLISLLGP
jgi:hypothetical protein